MNGLQRTQNSTQNTGTSGPTPRVTQAAFQAPVQAGSVVIASIGCSSDAAITSAVVEDLSGNTYAVAVSSFTQPGGAAIAFFQYGAKGAVTVKATITAAGATFIDVSLIAIEHATSGTVTADQVNTATGSATSINTGNVTIATAAELILAAVYDEQGIPHKWLTTWELNAENADNFAVATKLTNAAGTYSASFTYDSGSGGTNTAVVASFKNVVAGKYSGPKSVNLIDMVDEASIPDNGIGALIRSPFTLNGAIYTTLLGNGTKNIKPYLSLTNGGSWRLLDENNLPVIFTTYDVAQLGTTLWFVYQTAGTNEIIVQPFDMIAGRFGAASTGGPTTANKIKAAIRSDGTLIIFHAAGSIGIDFEEYDTVGLSWTSTGNTMFSAASFSSLVLLQTLTDPSDTIHLWFYTRATASPHNFSYRYQQLSSGDTPNTAATFYTRVGSDGGGRLNFTGTPSLWGTALALSMQTYDGPDGPPSDGTSLKVFTFDPYSSTTPTITTTTLLSPPFDTFWVWDNSTVTYGSGILRVTFSMFLIAENGNTWGIAPVWAIENSGSGWGDPFTVFDLLSDQPSQPLDLDFGNTSPYNPISVPLDSSNFMYLINANQISTGLSAYAVSSSAAAAPPPPASRPRNYAYVG